MFGWLLLAVTVGHAQHIGRQHESVRVQGTVLCNGTGYPDAKVIFFNHKVVPIKLAEARPIISGAFSIAWSGNELIPPVAPFINIYHRCLFEDQPLKVCSRVLGIEIPRNYVISNSSRVNATYDIGIMNLNLKFTHEIIDCFFGTYS
ncbi:unnamed protein product [Cylicocyclus nassatus]|uniref:Transthyretin-like family protein n=1 Tax=Cylicocyclus nassatus TaxID=53992 RepID=A0AA36HAG2_CYLNA|nr:unnamed protein product [Cylicocyclus nassatus]